MPTSSFPPHAVAVAVAVSIILALLRLCSSSTVDKGERFRECSRQWDCGRIRNLTYPFWGGDRPSFCGSPFYKLDCRENDYPVMNISDRNFSVLHVNQPPGKRWITLGWMDLDLERTSAAETSALFRCPPKTDLPQLYFPSFTSLSTVNITVLYNCRGRIPPNPFLVSTFTCEKNGKEMRGVFMGEEGSERTETEGWECEEVEVIPVKSEAVEGASRTGDLRQILRQGFDVNYLSYDSYWEQCESSGGRCGSNSTSPDSFECHCPDGPQQISCPKGNGYRTRRKILIGVGCSLGGIMIASIVFYFIYRYRKLSVRPALLSRNISSDPSSMNDSEKGSSFPGVHLFTYTELEQATNHFDPNRELGDGGFGTVYYGKLPDGRSVAVKRLYENNYKRVEQFLNEVEILTRLRHKNLVQLYGCTSRHSRELLLVYEFIQNGTVADHLHGQHAKPGGLPWPVRLKIAIETASALAYLHASDIIHRDVKTHNILLDDSFIVKVADFGLSRLFPTDVTHVSTAPQGTPGYVDPEYHQCYQLTDKSDVFSFGVVLVELISSKPAVDITRHRHEINLSNMAINKIQNRALHELVDPQLGFDSDYKVRKMITAVAEMAFQCLQCEKDMRPSMMEVLETLMRIESKDYNKQKAEEMDVSVEEVVLLKNGPPPLSPDSVTVKWNSSSGSTASTISS